MDDVELLAGLEVGAGETVADGFPASVESLSTSRAPAFSMTRRAATLGASELPSACSSPSSSKP